MDFASRPTSKLSTEYDFLICSCWDVAQTLQSSRHAQARTCFCVSNDVHCLKAIRQVPTCSRFQQVSGTRTSFNRQTRDYLACNSEGMSTAYAAPDGVIHCQVTLHESRCNGPKQRTFKVEHEYSHTRYLRFFHHRMPGSACLLALQFESKLVKSSELESTCMFSDFLNWPTFSKRDTGVRWHSVKLVSAGNRVWLGGLRGHIFKPQVDRSVSLGSRQENLGCAIDRPSFRTSCSFMNPVRAQVDLLRNWKRKTSPARNDVQLGGLSSMQADIGVMVEGPRRQAKQLYVASSPNVRPRLASRCHRLTSKLSLRNGGWLGLPFRGVLIRKRHELQQQVPLFVSPLATWTVDTSLSKRHLVLSRSTLERMFCPLRRQPVYVFHHWHQQTPRSY